MGWITCKAENTPTGVDRTLSADDTLSYKTEYPMEVLNAPWTPALDSALNSSGRGFRARPKVPPVNDTVLVGLRLGPSDAYQEQHGSRDRMALLDAGTSAITQLFEPSDDGTPVEREHDHWRRNHFAVDSSPVTPAASMRDQLALDGQLKTVTLAVYNSEAP